MKSILLSIQLQFTVRFFLQTDIFKVLKNSGNRIVILTPNADDEDFKKTYESDNVFIEKFRMEDLKVIQKQRLYTFFTKVRNHTYLPNSNFSTLDFKEEMAKYKLSKEKATIKNLLKKIFFISYINTSNVLRKSKFLWEVFFPICFLVQD